MHAGREAVNSRIQTGDISDLVETVHRNMK